jgi:hypothetical protein
VLSAVLMVSGMLVFGAQPSSATITKTIDVTCLGADDGSKDLLSKFPLPPIPVTATVEAPAFVEPGQTDVPISISWALTVPASLTDLLIDALKVASADVVNAKVDTEVSGPTSTTVIEGRPPNQTVNLVKGAGLTSTFGPFSGQLDDIGNSGVIKLRNQSVDFSMSVSAFPDPINMTCPIGATIATIPVKVAGSPDIKQPIEEPGVAGQSTTVDVLGKYVTNGKDKSGVERQVDPSTLKVVEGPGSVQGGKLVITSPPAGTSADITFEVCAGTVEVAPATEGIDEVQRIRLFHEPGNSFKRNFAATFNLGGDPGSPAWMIDQTNLAVMALGGLQPWSNKVLPYAVVGLGVPYQWPTDAEMLVALQSIPEIGAGNVEVTRGDIVVVPGAKGAKAYQYRDYEVHFTGAKGKQELPDLKTTHVASFLPQELLTNLLAQVTELGGSEGGEPKPPKYPVPAGMTAKEYLDQIWADAGKAWGQQPLPDVQTYFQKLQLWLGVFGENIMSLIDINAALAFISSLFPKTPEINWLTQGESPKPAEMQELCSQGVVTVRSASVEAATTTSVAGGGGGGGGTDAEGISFAG